jgi:hypothetical protein
MLLLLLLTQIFFVSNRLGNTSNVQQYIEVRVQNVLAAVWD